MQGSVDAHGIYRAVLKVHDREGIISAVMELGFTHVFQVEFTADMIHKEMVRQMENAEEKPVISSFCPAIVRLIQVRFPALVDISYW